MTCRIVISLEPSILRKAILRELRNRGDVCIVECNPSERGAIPHEFDVASQLRRLLLSVDASEETNAPWDRLDDVALVTTHDPAVGGHDVCVITNIESAEIIPSDIARWLTEFPELVVIGIHAASGKILSFRQTIEVEDAGNSLPDLVNAVEQLIKPSKARVVWRNQ